MTVKFAPFLCVAALLLAACGTVEDETPQTSVAQPMPVQKRVVHGPIVPDGPVRVAKRKRASTYVSSTPRRRAVAVAPVTAPAQVEPVETPKVETPAPTPAAPAPTTPAPTESAPATTADATVTPPPPATTTTPATTPEATTPPTETIVPPAAPVTSEPLPAPTETAPVETTSTESSQPLLPGLDPGKLPELLQMTFAGLPLWLIGLVGLVLVVALAIGFGGRRQPEHEDSI